MSKLKSMRDNDTLVDRLLEQGNIGMECVEKAFRETDRAFFVPDEYSAQAYRDRPLPIGEEATISAPHMIEINTELLEPEDGDRIVEVGSGSGYQVAILGRISEKVVGVEIEQELVEKSRERIEELGLENVEIRQGSGLGPVEGEFDGILFSCAIGSERFEDAKERLTDDGVLVAPVTNERGQTVKKFRDGETEDHGAVRFVGFKD